MKLPSAPPARPTLQMTPRTIALTLAAALVAGTAAHGQSTLPATAPTSMSSPISATSAAVTSGPATHRAQVTFIDGKLQVRADNSSLNLILREISRQTGMVITGGVADERVFGTYGPADPGVILATLLNGTGSNLLLQSDANNVPAKLILTPRTGGVTPPNPNASSFDEEDRNTAEGRDPEQHIERQLPQQAPQGPRSQGTVLPGVPAVAQPGTSTPVSIPQPINNVNGSENNTTPSASTYPTTNSVPLDSLPTPSTTPSSTGIVDSANPPPAGSTTPAAASEDTSSPKAALTPEDVVRQMQALHAKPQTGTSTPSTTAPQTSTPQQ